MRLFSACIILITLSIGTAGCSYTTESRLVSDAIGTELIATRPFPVDPLATRGSEPNWPVGTRLRIAQVRKHDNFLQVDWEYFGRVVDDRDRRLYLVNDSSLFLRVLSKPPAWFDRADPLRSARTASLAELDLAISSGKGLEYIAAAEVMRRWRERSSEALAAKQMFVDAMKSDPIGASYRPALWELNDQEFLAIRDELTEILAAYDKAYRRNDAYWLATSVRHRLQRE